MGCVEKPNLLLFLQLKARHRPPKAAWIKAQSLLTEDNSMIPTVTSRGLNEVCAGRGSEGPSILNPLPFTLRLLKPQGCCTILKGSALKREVAARSHGTFTPCHHGWGLTMCISFLWRVPTPNAFPAFCCLLSLLPCQGNVWFCCLTDSGEADLHPCNQNLWESDRPLTVCGRWYHFSLKLLICSN